VNLRKWKFNIVRDMTFFCVVQIYTTVSEKYVFFISMVAYSENRGGRDLRNVGKFLLNYTASHSKKQKSSYSTPSYFKFCKVINGTLMERDVTA